MDKNPLRSMGLSPRLLQVAFRHPQMIHDLVDRQGKNIAKTFHPDIAQENVSAEEFAEIYEPFSTWTKMTEEEKEEAIIDYQKPAAGLSDGARFLAGRDIERTDTLIADLQKMMVEKESALHGALQKLRSERQVTARLRSAMELFNPERNLEVSGLVQLVRSICLGRREAGGNVNRLNGYTFFARTMFRKTTKSVLKEEYRETGAEEVSTELALPGSETGRPKRASRSRPRLPADAYYKVEEVSQVETTLYFIREDTGVMATTVTANADPGKKWSSEALAVDSVMPKIMSLRARALARNFTPPPHSLGASGWKFVGHFLGYLDRVVPENKEAAGPSGVTITVGSLAGRLERDLSRLIQAPPILSKASATTLLVVEPVIADHKNPQEDIDIMYRYRQIVSMGSKFDPNPLPPGA